MKNENKRAPERIALRVAIVSIAGNTMLALMKAIAGWVAGSDALISDAVHSAADLSSSVIVIFGVRMAAQAADREHPYGHERFECVAAIVLAMVLLITGMFIGLDAVEHIRSEEAVQQPGALALVMAAVSVLAKEGLFRYTWFHALRQNSGVLRADAWHHRSDALCSIGVFVGIQGARMGMPVLDSIASLVICGFIIRAAYDIFRDAIQKMVDHACSAATEDALCRCARELPGVLAVKTLRTREFGSRIFADMVICVDGGLTLAESDRISKQVHGAVETQFPQVKHVAVSAIPIKGDSCSE